MPIRAVLADDHVLVRQSLKSFLEREDIQVAGEASDGQELLGVVARLCPDVAVVDISMPLMNGIEAAGEMRRASPKTRTILLTRQGIRSQEPGSHGPRSCHSSSMPWRLLSKPRCLSSRG